MSSGSVSSIMRGSVQLFGARAANILARLIYVVTVTRFLGPELYGRFIYGQSFYLSFMPFSALVFATLLTRRIGINRERGSQEAGAFFGLQLLTSSVAFAACAGVALGTEQDPQMRALLMIFALALLMRTLASWCNELFVAFESAQLAFRQEAIFRPLEVVLAIGVLVAGGGLLSVALVHAGVWALQAAVGLRLVRGRLIALVPRWAWVSLSRIVVEGLPLLGYSIAATWLIQGPLVVAQKVGLAAVAVGHLALLMQILSHTNALFGGVVNAAALPVLSRLSTGEARAEVGYADLIVRVGLLLVTPALVLGDALGPHVVPLVFGAGYQEAGDMLEYAVMLVGPMIALSASHQVLVAQGRFKAAALCALAGAVSLTVALLSMAPGVDDTLISLSIAFFVWGMGLVVALQQGQGLELRRVLLAPLAVTAVSAGAFFAARGGSVLLASGLAAGLWLLGLRFSGVVRAAERRAITEALGRLRRS